MGSTMVNCRQRVQVSFCVYILIIVFWVISPIQCAAATDPLSQVKQSIEQVVEILRQSGDNEEKWVWKKEEIVRIVKKRFDSEELAQRVLAKHWKKRSDQEKEYFKSLFASVLENTYINRVKSYSGEQFTFEKQIVKGDKAMVYSYINYNNQEIPINYRLKKKDGEWFVYDVIIEGVSLVNNYRKQFAEVIRREKYAGLVLRMEEKIQQTKEKDSKEK